MNIDKYKDIEYRELISDKYFMQEVNSFLLLKENKAPTDRQKKAIDIFNKSFKKYIGVDLADFNKNMGAAEIAEFRQIEKLEGITPTKYIIPNNRMIKKYVCGEITEGKTNLNVGPKNKKETITKIALNYDDDNIEIQDKNNKFSPYTRVILNAVCSLWEAGNVNLTPDQVYRCMNGLDDKQFVSPQAVEFVTESIDTLRRIMAKIDYTEEAKLYNKKTGKFTIEDTLISAKKISIETRGIEVVGYKLNSKPILYEYAQVSGQVLTIPSKLLNTKAALNSTPEVIIIREYLIREIEWMKSKKSTRQNNITLLKVYEELELDPTKEKAKKIRSSIEKILDSFKSDNYIKDYKLYKDGRAFKGINIVY